MKVGKIKRIYRRGIACILATVCTFTYVGASGAGMFCVQAEEIDSLVQSNSGIESNRILSMSDSHAGVIKKDGSLWMWGDNGGGALGIINEVIDDGEGGTHTEGIHPTPEHVMDHVKSVSCGAGSGNGTLVVKDDNSLLAWGSIPYSSTYNNLPKKIMEDVKAADTSSYHSTAIKTDGSLWMWGYNIVGCLGDGTTENRQEAVKIMDDVVKIDLVGNNSAAIQSDGSLWVWGSNNAGQLGDGTTENSYKPIKIMDDVVDVNISTTNGAALKQDGSLWMWGWNSGAYGNGTVQSSDKPVQVMDGVVAFSFSGSAGAAIKQDGSLWTWGSNAYGELGNGTTESNATANMIMEDVAAVCMSDCVSAAIKADGSLWTWGCNDRGQLGNGTTENSAVPIQIMPAGSIDASNAAASKLNIEITNMPRVKVVDSKGEAIVGATVTYNQKTFITSGKGIVSLDNYKKGRELVISKTNYSTLTVPYFAKSKTGIDTYMLANEGGLIYGIYLNENDIKTNMLTTAALINTFNSSKSSEFEIEVASYRKYARYDLYSGDKIISISNTGIFSNLKPNMFSADEPVYLFIEQNSWGRGVKIRLNLNVVNIDPPVDMFYLGNDGLKVSIPDNVPIVGGRNIEIELDDLPMEWNFKSDGTYEVGINFDRYMKDEGMEFKEVFSSLKKLDKDSVSSFLGYDYEKYVKTEIKPDFRIIGYAEGTLNPYQPFYLQGKLFVEFSMEFACESQLSIGPVPVVLEISIEGKVNADGSIRWSATEGFGGSVGVGGGIKLGVYGGIGFAKVASFGVYGSGEFGLHYVILPENSRGLDEVYIGGDIGLKAEIFGRDVQQSLLSGKWYIIGNDGRVRTLEDQVGWAAYSIDNYNAYNRLGREYLSADGSIPEWLPDKQSYVNGSTDETVLQNATNLDAVPQVIRMGDTVMLFYLTDGGAVRSAADRSMLVYSLWDETAQEWGEPKAVLDDGTADYNPDLYTDGEKIYAVWQDAGEKLADGLSLEETAKRLTLHAAVYDAQQDVFTDLGRIESENSLFQQNPQIVADKNSVSVYWYENAQDNVLGLSGTNRIYRAVLTDQDVLTRGIRVMSVPEEDPADTKDGEPETEESEADEPVEETPGIEDPEADEPAKETPETEETVSENTASAFRKFVALTEETPGQKTMTREESVSENTMPEDGEESNMPPADPGEDEDREEEDKDPAEEVTKEEPSDGGDEEPENPAGSVSDNTTPEGSVSENTVSENSIPKNTLQANANGAAKRADSLWTVTFLQEEGNCIFSADAGRMNGNTGYAFVAGTMDQFYNVEESKVSFIEQGQAQAKVLKSGTAEKAEFLPVYAEETLTWYESGDIHYIDENGSIADLFGESRIPSWSYTLLSDGTSPEVLFPVNAGGKANLYRISRENEAFLPALQVTDQEDYIQYADGFVKDGQTILVYNKMKVNDKLEEVNNSLCTGTIAHSYYDIVLQSAGSMILYREDTGKDELEITAKLYNNGTIKAENLSLSLCAPDGSILETVPVDVTLESGEAKYVSAVFSLNLITQEAEYNIKVIGDAENNTENNVAKIRLGGAALQVDAQITSVADTRTLYAGIRNTGVTPCGGSVTVRDMETGEEYGSSTFEPIAVGTTAITEINLEPALFAGKDEVSLEVIVVPDREEAETVRDMVVAYAPFYEVNFVTDEGTTTVYANYGTKVSFPANPAKEGKHFIGWYDAENPSAGTLYTEETPIKKDLTLYACFADEERTQIPLSECSVSEIPMQYYTGGQLKPKVTVKWGSEVLKENRDYKITYQNNKEQGQAAAVITAVTGNGKKYTGSIERSFSIMYPTGKVSVKTIPAVNFDGTFHTPEPAVTYQNKKLEKNKDYTVSYFNNRNAGTAGVTITGKGTFSGEKTVTFQIKGTAISGMKFEKIPDVAYNGKNTRPIVTVRTKDGKKQLMSGSDYRLVYENTVNKGTATVTVIGNGNYTGTKKLTYKVTAKPLAESMIAVEQPAAASVGSGEESAAASADTAAQISPVSLAVLPEKAVYQYTGKPVKPALTVTDQAAGDAALVLNKDYTVSYSKNKAVGEAQITVKGKGNYSGTVKVPFTISPVDLSQGTAAGTIRVKVNDIAYTGKALKPAVQVYETADGKERKLSGGAYTLDYSNNTEKGIGTVSITGKEKSGYTGTVTAQFRIVDKAKLVTASAIKIDGIPAQTYTGNALEPALHIVDKSDKNHEATLEKGTHYEVTYRNNVNAGKATVTVRGIGSYAGSKDLTFKINKRAFADRNGLCAGFTVGNPVDMKYTGYALKPDVTVKDGEKSLVQGKDYKLSYGKNTNIGTAAVTVTGIGNYSGSYKGAAFQIRAWDYNTLTAEIEDQTYMGKALKPQVKFYMTGENGREEILLKPNAAVKIVYKDNKNAGTATAVISGKGELANITPITVNFEIERADVSEAVVSRIPNQTLKGAAVRPIPKVKVGRNRLKGNRDFTVSYLRNGVKGEATAIIKGVGNYTGECRKTFIVQ